MPHLVQRLCDFALRQGAVQVKTLDEIATMMAQELELLRRLHALRNDFKTKFLSQGDAGFYNGISGILAQVADEGPVNF